MVLFASGTSHRKPLEFWCSLFVASLTGNRWIVLDCLFAVRLTVCPW